MTAPDPATLPSFASLVGGRTRVKIVDIGANPLDGAPPYQTLLAAGDADVVGFEPNPEALARLHALDGPTETYLPHAIGDGARRTRRVCRAPGMTSLLEPNRAVLELFHGFPEWGEVVAREEIDTRRLDDIPETRGVDMIKIDIQGGELMALQNARQRLKTTLVIQTEIEFLPLYVDQPLFSEVELYLRGQGFVFHRFYPQVSRTIRPMVVGGDIYAGMSQLVWADAIFVRDFTCLEALSEPQLLKAGAILHACYGSIDLTLRLLAEHDTRTGGALGPRYLAGLQAGPT